LAAALMNQRFLALHADFFVSKHFNTGWSQVGQAPDVGTERHHRDPKGRLEKPLVVSHFGKRLVS